MNSLADVLVVTAARTATQAVMQSFQAAATRPPVPRRLEERMVQDLGIVNDMRVFMLPCDPILDSPSTCRQALARAIGAISPTAVILAGTVFGIDSTRESIGDVIVSQKLARFEIQPDPSAGGRLRINRRGEWADASPWLVSCLHSADLYWDESAARVRFGLILSGENLVDDAGFRQKLRDWEPDALGGELEGDGLYLACQQAKVDWILVKGICGWAVGDNSADREERQSLAANNTARFVLHALQHTQLRRDMPAGEHGTQSPAAQVRYSTVPRQPYFFGRERELAVIAEALLPESRSWGALIDGPGGIGKTALAIRAAHIAPESQFPLKLFLSAKVRELTPAGPQTLPDFLLPNYLALLTELACELGELEIARTAPEERANAVRRALRDRQVLLIIDNVETFDERERLRLCQFLTRLPGGCKAIVTSRRRSDIDARIIRLDRLTEAEAMDLVSELATRNPTLARTGGDERRQLYELTSGNPLLITWVAGQLNRPGSKCHTVAQAFDYIRSAPADNDPLEFIFGDLLDTFTESETAVVAALAHFSQPGKVEWIAELAGLPRPIAQTALQDLADRALLTGDEGGESFLLSRLAATFLRQKRPEAVARAGDRLTDRAYATVMENGWENYDHFPRLEDEWPAVSAALPLFLQGDNAQLQTVCDALNSFLNFSARWDDWLSMNQQGESRALAAGDRYKAGWRAYCAGRVHALRRQAAGVVACADRCEAYWQQAGTGAREKASAIRLRGLGHQLRKDYAAALAAFQDALALSRTISPECTDVANALNNIALVQHESGDHDAAERNYREALRMSTKLDYQEGIAYVTGNLATLALDREDWPAAEVAAREALALAEALGRQEEIGSDCKRLAKALARQDRPLEALPYAQRAVGILARLRHQDLREARDVLSECERRASA